MFVAIIIGVVFLLLLITLTVSWFVIKLFIKINKSFEQSTNILIEQKEESEQFEAQRRRIEQEIENNRNSFPKD